MIPGKARRANLGLQIPGVRVTELPQTPYNEGDDDAPDDVFKSSSPIFSLPVQEASLMRRLGSSSGLKSVVITVAFIFLFIVAVLLDLQYLYLMAVTLAVLPLASYGIAAFFTARFAANRLHPTTVPEGKRSPILLEIRTQGGLPQAALRVADVVPPDLAPGGDAAVFRTTRPPDTWDGVSGEQTYFIEAQRRGVFPLGPVKVETTDPLGLFVFTTTVDAHTEIVVHPEPLFARDRSIGGEGSYGIRERDGKTRKGQGMDFHGVREYQPGDELRRVHWRTTARTGKLAVVEFERAYQQNIVIALDLARGTEHGKDRETTLEYAIKVAATLADRTLKAGGGVTLITQSARATVRPREGDPEAARFQLFDLMARAKAEAETSLATSLQAARFGEGMHYAVLTSGGDSHLTAYLANRVMHGDSVRIYFFEPTSFGGPRVTSPAVVGGELRVIEHKDSPWAEGGRQLEYLLRETE
ncbi:MAG: DUF58 domain-containing protein [Cytophagales bacterium]|nr:DUF58 domain-containing protein [Armatimonadota bacterium]